jgi:hypothetical protein
LRKIFSVSNGSYFSKLIVAIPFLLLGLSSLGQNLEVDSTRIVELDQNAEEVHSPRKATIYSAVLPGLGQAYNKKYWKIPVIYAGFAAFGYFIYWNNDNYQIMKQAYSDFTDGDPETNSYLDLDGAQYYDLGTEPDDTNFKQAVLKQQDYYRRNRDLLVISIVGFYGLQIIDASVDAHFFDFDISEDLTLNWQPTMNYFNQQTVYGINCTFTF